MNIKIINNKFDPFNEIASYQQEINQKGKYGAVACLIGCMREFNEGDRVNAMRLSSEPGVTENILERICRSAKERFDVLEVLMIHATGEVKIGDPMVVVAAWATHRAAAVEACDFMISDLKSRKPFGKQEAITDSQRWVERNTLN